jgi:hypothetical protein
MSREFIEKLRYERKNRELIKLGLSTRIVNALQQVGVTTFDLLLQVTVKELQKDVPNLGKISIDSVLALVSSKGFKLVGQDLYEEKQLRKKPKREWVGLTQNEIKSCWLGYKARGCAPERIMSFYKLVETNLKEKNDTR